MERRVADGIDGFLDEMRKMDHVGGVEITPALQHTNGTTGDGRICEARRDREHRRSGGDECEYDREQSTAFSPTPLVKREGDDIAQTQGTNLL